MEPSARRTAMRCGTCHHTVGFVTSGYPEQGAPKRSCFHPEEKCHTQAPRWCRMLWFQEMREFHQLAPPGRQQPQQRYCNWQNHKTIKLNHIAALSLESDITLMHNSWKHSSSRVSCCCLGHRNCATTYSHYAVLQRRKPLSPAKPYSASRNPGICRHAEPMSTTLGRTMDLGPETWVLSWLHDYHGSYARSRQPMQIVRLWDAICAKVSVSRVQCKFGLYHRCGLKITLVVIQTTWEVYVSTQSL